MVIEVHTYLLNVHSLRKIILSILFFLHTLLTIPVELLLTPFCSSFPVTLYALVTSLTGRMC